MNICVHKTRLLIHTKSEECNQNKNPDNDVYWSYNTATLHKQRFRFLHLLCRNDAATAGGLTCNINPHWSLSFATWSGQRLVIIKTLFFMLKED